MGIEAQLTSSKERDIFDGALDVRYEIRIFGDPSFVLLAPLLEGQLDLDRTGHD